MAEHKLDLLILEYRKQLGMRNLEFKTVAGTTHLIEVKWPELQLQILLTPFSIRKKGYCIFCYIIDYLLCACSYQ